MSGINRLAELKSGGDDDDVPITSSASNQEVGAHMRLYEPIKRGLEIIRQNVEKVEKLKARERQTANEKGRKEIMTELDAIMAETSSQGAQIKAALDKIKNDNAKAANDEDEESAKSQMRVNLYQTHIRRFHQVMNDYNSKTHEFKQDLQDRVRRQLKIVKKDMDDDEIEKIVESGKAPDVIKQALISDTLMDAVRDIEERHLDIMKLEAQVLEVYELFRDLANLVDLQQESLDVIENRVQNAKHFTEKAEVELIAAEKYQRKARNRKCCLLMILLGALIAILAPILATQIKSS